jgi:hypothetical protein
VVRCAAVEHARKHGILDADMTHAFNQPISVDDTRVGPVIIHTMPARFETHEPGDLHEATELRLVRAAFLARADAERVLGDAVVRARHDGHS